MKTKTGTSAQLLFDFAVVVDTGCGRNNGHCCDCSVDTIAIGEFYVVSDEVWRRAGRVGFLCIGCLERRLGRTLMAEDFIEVPLNKSAGHSDRLNSRMAAFIRARRRHDG
jgi:hypothetical protein